MKTVDNFFRTISLDRRDDGFGALVEISSDHPVYRGHFPGRAVVPGVFTMAVVRECASTALGRAVSYAAVKECKFVTALLPEAGLTVTLDFTISEDGKIAGTVKYGEATVLKLKATLK